MNSKNQEASSSNPLTDEELQSLLSDIEIPQDLKQRLALIPLSDSSPEHERETKDVVRAPKESDRKPVTRRRWVGIAIAASVLLAAMLGFDSLQSLLFSGSGEGRMARLEIQSMKGIDSVSPMVVNPQGAPGVQKADPDSNSVLVQLALQDQELSEQILVLEYQAKIDSLQRQLRPSAMASLAQSDLASRREAASVILAMSGKAMVRYEGSIDGAVEEMKFVIENYPESRGAEIAIEFINQVANPNQH